MAIVLCKNLNSNVLPSYLSLPFLFLTKKKIKIANIIQWAILLFINSVQGHISSKLETGQKTSRSSAPFSDPQPEIVECSCRYRPVFRNPKTGNFQGSATFARYMVAELLIVVATLNLEERWWCRLKGY